MREAEQAAAKLQAQEAPSNATIKMDANGSDAAKGAVGI